MTGLADHKFAGPFSVKYKIGEPRFKNFHPFGQVPKKLNNNVFRTGNTTILSSLLA